MCHSSRTPWFTFRSNPQVREKIKKFCSPDTFYQVPFCAACIAAIIIASLNFIILFNSVHKIVGYLCIMLSFFLSECCILCKINYIKRIGDKVGLLTLFLLLRSYSGLPKTYFFNLLRLLRF